MRLATAAVLAAVLVAGCDRRRNVNTPYADEVADAIPRIEAATGLKYKSMPRLEVRSRAQVRDFLLRRFEESTPASQIRGEEAAYKLFGLIPDTLDLRRFLLALFTEQIVGYYDPAAKVLYVVDGAPADLAGITVTHELVHALQDQYVNLDSIQNLQGNSDRQAAAQAVMEGQATYEQMAVMLGGGNVAARLPGGWDRVREMIRESQSSMPVFATAPMAIQESLLFPYLSGAEFIRRFHDHYPQASPLDSLPVSTEQILHEGAFFGNRDAPTDVVLPPTRDTLAYDDVMGEFGTRLLLFQHLKNNTDAIAAAQGWDGDRFRLVRTPAGAAVAWVSVWDAPLEAAQFVDALGRAVGRRYRTSAPGVTPAGVRTYTGSGRTVVLTPFEIDGRPVVSYVDVPAGQSTRVIDASRVRLRVHP